MKIVTKHNSTFQDCDYERGKNISETLINFLKANPYQPEDVIVGELSKWQGGGYNYDYIRMNLKKLRINKKIERVKGKHTSSKREIFIYYINN